MGKRSAFTRHSRDFYVTPEDAVQPLLPHITNITTFVEPCAGDGALVEHLCRRGKYCVDAVDIEPQTNLVRKLDALSLRYCTGQAFITNPPWSRPILHELIVHLSELAETWLLFDADWMHTKQSQTLIKRCKKIVSVGRLKWIPGTKMTGKDNCAWYLFDNFEDNKTIFIGR